MMQTTLISSLITLLSSLIMLKNTTIIHISYPFLSILSSQLEINLIMDWTSMLFMSSVLLISSMIMKFSMTYIPTNEHNRFFLTLNLFILSMLLLISSDSIIFTLLGWDGLGLSSYILVMYYQNHSSFNSAAITLFSNRVGDICLIISIALIWSSMELSFSNHMNYPTLTLMLIAIASMTKSAQIPFSSWLPAAMAAPTPISALVHSSTLVTAGTYLMIRLTNSPHPLSTNMLMTSAVMTTMLSGLAANWEQDMKKIIALSTLSQIAIIMFAASMNMYNLAFFHLITHAYFKSTMFLCAGSIIHATNYQDMRHMGSMMNMTPVISSALGVTTMALSGLPFFSGFYSKDAIMESLYSYNQNPTIFLLMTTAITMTSCYSLRLSLNTMKLVVKKNPDILISNNNNNIIMPIMLMSPLSITLGSSLTWVHNPQTHFLMPMIMKSTTMIAMLTGIIIAMSLNFNSKKYNTTGNLSISLWLLNMLSWFPPTSAIFSSTLIQTNDKTWHEHLTANGTFTYLLYSHTLAQNTINKTLLLISLLTILIPIMCFDF